MCNFDKNKQAFFDIKKETEDILNKDYYDDTPCSVQELENGIVLPIVKDSKNHNAGGVCNSNFEFVAGLVCDKNLKEDSYWVACMKSYAPKTQPIKRNETVIFGGILFNEFGHVLRDTFVRLWYIFKNPDIKHKIVFINPYGKDGLKFEYLLHDIGITKERFELITVPTQFDKIIIPDQSIFIKNSYREELAIVFDSIISKVKPAKFKKVYLSRSKYKRTVSFRESYFEDFYKKRGFEIIYPETLPFLEQVSIMNGADEVVCDLGTHIMLSFFCRDGIKLTALGRTYDSFVSFGIGTALQSTKIEMYLVDVNNNFLPTTHSQGVFFYGPTKYWINYLNSNNIPYESDEVSFNIHIKPYVLDYLIEWAKHYSNPQNFTWIRDFTLADVVKIISRTVLETDVDTKQLPERIDVIKMQHYIKHLQSNGNNNNDLKETVTHIIAGMEIEENLQKFATQTQTNFKGAQNAVIDLQNKNNELNKKVTSLEWRIAELEKLINKEQ